MSNANEHHDHGHGPDDGHGHGHGSRFIQHHYDDAQHQFDAGKLGVWFFLVQEVLFFSGLFVAYVLYRSHHPEIFAYAHHYLDVKFGAINTAVLIVSSLTAAWSVRCAQLNQRKALIGCLAATIVCAFGFLGIKYIEYSHKFHEGILWGKRFDPCVSSGGGHLLTRAKRCPGTLQSACFETPVDQLPDAPGVQATCKVEEVRFAVKSVTATETDEKTGVAKQVTKQDKQETARRALPACEFGHAGPGAAGAAHGAEAEGHAPPASGAHHGPPTNAPCWVIADNHQVCPKGPAAMVLYGDHDVRSDSSSSTWEIQAACEPPPAAAPAPADPFADTTDDRHLGEPLIQPKQELSKHELQHQFSLGPPPENTNMFFSIYFAMTGLHGIHVLAGIIIYIWLLIRAIKGHFTPDYFGPVDYAALYWHLVDLIWIFLFPLLYLIH